MCASVRSVSGRQRRAIAIGCLSVWLGVSLCASRGASAAAPAAPSALPSGIWRVLEAWPGRGEFARALAWSGRAGLAVGDEAGVAWWRAGRWSRAQLPASDALAFDAAGRLWIGTQDGLFVWSADARPERRRLRDGEGSNRVLRIVAEGAALVVATEAGAYWSGEGDRFQALDSGSAAQAVTQVAVLRGGGAGSETRPTQVWSFGGEGLVRVIGIEAAAGLRIVDRAVIALPRPAAEAGVVDLRIDAVGERLLLVYRDAIAVRPLGAGLDRDAVWQSIRPVLPPGAAIERLALGQAGRIWLATDHGLLAADTLDGRYARAASPAGSRACGDLVEAPGALSPLAERARAVALCRPSLLALVEAPAAPDRAASEPTATDPAGAERGAASEAVAAAAGPIQLPPDPPVAGIRARALARVGLSVDRADRLWRGLRRRGLWPSLELRGAWDEDRDRSHSRDQSFVSGDTRDLLDRDRGAGRHYGAAVVLDWELGELAYPDDSDDLSRELRQVTSLRDDVADEIHQLYFERQRIRAQLLDAARLAPGEADLLVLRAEEIEAGLDAWSGGFLADWRAAGAPREPKLHPIRSERAID